MYKDIKTWRHNVRRKLVEGFGSSCAICGLIDDPVVYDIHHVDPAQKEFTLTNRIRKWDDMAEEASKCALLCAPCHRKLHAGLQELPVKYRRFVKVPKPEIPKDNCPICQTLKRTTQVTCSSQCSAKNREKLDWDAAVEYYRKCQKYSMVARRFGCSDNTVKKQMLKRGVSVQ